MLRMQRRQIRSMSGLLIVGVAMSNFATSAKASSASLPRKPVPNGILELPSGGESRILSSQMHGTVSARKLLTRFQRELTGYFNQFKVVSAVSDRADQNLQAEFTARLDVVPVRGLIKIRMQGSRGQVTMLFDRASAPQWQISPVQTTIKA